MCASQRSGKAIAEPSQRNYDARPPLLISARYSRANQDHVAGTFRDHDKGQCPALVQNSAAAGRKQARSADKF